MWEGHQFGVFGNFTRYDNSDIIITPVGNFCNWEKYCRKVENKNLCRNDSTCDKESVES